mmetsp:Transcript_72792/g.115201  ORF Transcript_72792/g.115201 Transcript_72792/m.115201 type:complete len:425 (+) Transcript_72792:73-1347(+)
MFASKARTVCVFCAILALLCSSTRNQIKAKSLKTNASTQSQDFCSAKFPELTATGAWVFSETPSPEEQPDPKKRQCDCACNGLECFRCERGELGGTGAAPTCTIENGCQEDEEEVDGKCKKTKDVEVRNPCDAFQPPGELHGFECVVETECPEPLSNSTVLFSKAGSCTCRYDVVCPPMKGWRSEGIVNRGDSVICKYETVVPKAEPTVTPATCMEGTVSDGETCRIPMDCPPGPIQLSYTALACGPKSDKFIGRMFEELEMIAESTFDKPHQQSCKTTCTSVWAKVAECAHLAEQDTSSNKVNSWTACIGATATRGVQKIDFSQLMRKDNSKKMFWRLRSRGDNLHCTSAFASAVNFDGKTWFDLTRQVEGLAAKNYVRLQGTYVNKPSRSISCRDGYCNAADLRGASLPACLSHCEKSFPNK